MKNDESWDDYQPSMYVMIEGNRVYNDDPDIEVLGVEEDIQGRDVLTVEYRGKQYRSLVFIG